MSSWKSIFSKPFLLLLLTIFLSEGGSTVVTPLMPFLFFSPHSTFFAESAGHVTRAVGYGYATAAIRIGGFLASVLLGWAMDVWGRRWVLFVSCFGLACAMGVLAISIDRGAFELFIAGLFFCNVLYAGKQTAQAMVGDEKRSNAKLLRMSLLQAGIALGACVGPMSAGSLSKFSGSFSLPFWMAAICALVSAGVVVMGIAETLLKASPRSPAHPKKRWFSSGMMDVLRGRRVQGLFLQLFLTQLSWGTYYEFSPLAAKLNFNFSPAMTGMFVGMVAFWLIVGSALMLPLLQRRCSGEGLKQLSILLMLVGTVMAPLSTASAGLWISAALVAMGDVMVYALIVNELSDAVAPVYQGRMTGLVYVVFTLTWSFTGVLGGYLTAYVHNGALWFGVLGVLLLSGFLGFQRLRASVLKKG